MRNALLALALGGALAVAGCTSSPPASDQPIGPTSGGGAPGQGGNSTSGNTTGNATAPPSPAPRAPETVHESSYQWTVQAPAEATFSVPEGFTTLLLNVTQDGPGVGTLTIELVDPTDTAAGETSVTAAPDGAGSTTLEVPAQPGDWTLRFGGAGVGTLNVLAIAS